MRLATAVTEHRPSTVNEALRAGTARLQPRHNSARLDTEVLLATAMDEPRYRIYILGDSILSDSVQQRFTTLLERRANGEPVSYLTGQREFWSRDFRVTPDTLIPRPDTECLVESALAELPVGSRATIADLGTGSGAIGITIALERPQVRVIASDCNPVALTVAQTNAKRLGATNMTFRHGDWCAVLADDEIDMLVCNPPYIRADDPHLNSGDLPFEPRQALIGGADGLAALHTLIRQAPRCLRSNGYLILEHGFDQGTILEKLLSEHDYTSIRDIRDHAGHSRVAMARTHSTSPSTANGKASGGFGHD